MENQIIEPLLEKAQAYTTNTIELLKLQAMERTAKVGTSMITRLILTVVVSFFIITVNIAIALWLGEMLGKAYYGFFVVAGCYALAAVILVAARPFVKKRVHNAVVRQMFD